MRQPPNVECDDVIQFDVRLSRKMKSQNERPLRLWAWQTDTHTHRHTHSHTCNTLMYKQVFNREISKTDGALQKVDSKKGERKANLSLPKILYPATFGIRP